MAEGIESLKKLKRENKPIPNWLKTRYIDGSYKNKKYDFRKWYKLVDAPFNLSNKCCDINKEQPSKRYEKETGKIPILGIMAQESKVRTMSWLQYGCNAFDSNRKSCRPIMFWTEQDILQYIKNHNLKIAEEYGDIIDIDGQIDIFGNVNHKYKLTGNNRTGCKLCLFGISIERDRLIKYKEMDKQFYDYAMRGGEFVDGVWQPKNGLGLKFVIDWLNENIDTFKKKPILY